ncbi:Eng1 Endo-1,3-beta-glucanase [Candida orthopsilosis Co 90-125]|uniref:glucan endo-1,3-beta-D-glucosidase n=1 Tax=Candida orthopsilosis (strain 90-125) TaxID=1136231 RepID=H8X1Y2_CANO9|nr:Eng1 Endo-1,3-beta-glucanase [Candida orthopsilosis Co 90-125]CCG22703.1 Eng1 Endo-1,3-beta-glucanase [Candida orthopsilosis Co 90-125]
MNLKSLLTAVLPLMVATAAAESNEEEILTVTRTHFVTSPCISYFASSLLPNNPEGLTTGIPVVFVHAPKNKENQKNKIDFTSIITRTNTHIVYETGVPKSKGGVQVETKNGASCSTITTYSTITHETSTCSSEKCQVHTYTTVIPSVYTIIGDTAAKETSVAKAKSDSESQRLTNNGKVSSNLSGIAGEASRNTNLASFLTTSIDVAQTTTTSTIFSATETPESTYSPSTSLESLPTTKSAPVTSQSVVSETKSITIDLSSITDNVTISNNTTEVSTVNGNSTSSLLSISSELSSSSQPLETTLSTILISSSAAGPYFNSSIVSISHSTSALSTGSSESEISSPQVSSEPSFAESSTSSSSSTETRVAAATDICYSGDLFSPIDTNAPPLVFPRQQLPLSIPAGVNNNGVPIQTNKFYANLFLGDQDSMVYTYPYGIYWSKTSYYGFGVQHTNISNRVFGSQNTNNPGVSSYYFNPTNNGEIILSATEFTEETVHMALSDMTEMAANIKLSTSSGDDINYLEIPVVQGMGFVTGIYNGNLIPELNSLYGIRTLELEKSDALLSNILKYRATLFNGVEWLIYITLPTEDDDFEFTADDSYHLKASKSVDGLIIQVALAPETSKNQFYDAAAGMYVTDATIQGSVACSSSASYSFAYETSGSSSSGKPIIFALPHHLHTLTSTSGATGITVSSPTKGEMIGFLTNELSFLETIDKNIQFLPYLAGRTGSLSYSSDQLTLLATSANDELAVDIASTVANMNSNYFSGKVIDKYAQILLVVSEIIDDEAVTNATLSEMKDAFETFLNNQQYYPLMYDTKFGGVTSTAAQNGDNGADFGSAFYNDHHFHYGYFVHAAAVVGYIDKKLGGTWAQDHKHWVNSLVRDVANPSRTDSYFPVSRSFSWYDGHSWAAGLYESNDGKNQESSSEDIHFAYGMKLWGSVIEDYAMEARGGLMLSLMSRAFNMYFYYKSDNTVQPQEILPNKVSGIFFENKVDYTTYFGTPDQHPEYVHGIHMLPITAASSSVRISSYVEEEWQDQISTFIDNVDSGWTGILRLNQAIIDAQSSYEFFSSNNWSSRYLDNGQSRTWSLAFSAGVL